MFEVRDRWCAEEIDEDERKNDDCQKSLSVVFFVVPALCQLHT